MGKSKETEPKGICILEEKIKQLENEARESKA